MSNYRRGRGGYTIIEVVVVLTVSALLFASSIAAYTQQNRRTQFTNSVNDFAQGIQDVLNDVQNGFYPSANSFSCTVSGTSPPAINYSGNNQQGTNTDCIFVGKAIQFYPQSGTPSDVDVFTVVGRRLDTSGNPVSDISQAKPKGLDSLVDRKTLSNGVRITAVKQIGGPATYSGLAIVANSGVSGGLSSGIDSRANIATVHGSLHNSKSVFLNNILTMSTGNINEAQNGLAICLSETGAGARTAVIELAAGSTETIVNTEIDTPCP